MGDPGTKILWAKIREIRPHVLLCGSRGGNYVCELFKWYNTKNPQYQRDHPFPGTIMINACGSRPNHSGFQLPKNTAIALVYGINDDDFKFNPADIYKRAQTGTPGLAYCYVTDEGHDIDSLSKFNPQGLPELIKAVFTRDFRGLKFPATPGRCMHCNPEGVSRNTLADLDPEFRTACNHCLSTGWRSRVMTYNWCYE